MILSPRCNSEQDDEVAPNPATNYCSTAVKSPCRKESAASKPSKAGIALVDTARSGKGLQATGDFAVGSSVFEDGEGPCPTLKVSRFPRSSTL